MTDKDTLIDAAAMIRAGRGASLTSATADALNRVAERADSGPDRSPPPLALLGIRHAADAEGVEFSAPAGVRVFRWGTPHDGVLLVHLDKNEWLTWALLDFHYAFGSRTTYDVLAHGSGAGSPHLREPRHTYFGDDGYVFYVNAKLLSWAFAVLGEWFDFD